MRFGIRELLFFAVLIGMPVAAYYYVFKPGNEEIVKARAEIETKQKKLAQLEQATAKMEDLGKEIDELKQVIEMFEAKLPAEKEVEVILKEVWELAARRGLNPKSVRTDKPIRNHRYTELPIKMVIIGNFDGFYGFLLDLEKLSRITRIPEMKLKRSKNEDGQMEAVFTLSIFFEPDAPKTVAAGG